MSPISVVSAVFLCCFLPFGLAAQLDKANGLYKQKRYAEAIAPYEEALAKKDQLAVRAKLAHCYLLTNRMDTAEALFARIVAQPKAKPEHFFRYAETLMANGKYAEAKKWFLKHFEAEPLDSASWRMARNCDLAPLISPYFSWIQIEAAPFSSEADDNSASLWRGSVVFTSDRAGGSNFLKQKSGWTGRDFLRLYRARIDSTGRFEAPKPFSARLNQLNKNTANASFTADGERVFFTRNADFTGSDHVLNLQLYEAERAPSGGWKKPSLLPFCQQEVNYMHPAISPDGTWLVFASNKSGGLGGFDLFFTKKTEKGWSRPQNLGPSINTAEHDGFPFIAADGRLFFASKGWPGFGGFDVFVSKFDSTTGHWAEPRNLGKPLNGSRDDLSIWLSEDGSMGLFSSSRDGDDDDVFVFWTGPKKPLLPSSDKENDDETAENASESLFGLDSMSRFLTENRLKAGQEFALASVVFDSATAIEPRWSEAEGELERLGAMLSSSPLLKIEISCRADAALGPKKEQKIARARAESLRKWLSEKKGVPEGQLLIAKKPFSIFENGPLGFFAALKTVSIE